MEIAITEYKRVAVVQPSGRVDSNTSQEFEAALRRLTEGGRNALVLDLSRVEFLSSAGLRVMVTTMKTVRKSAGSICVAAPTQRVAEVLRLAGLDSVFEIFETREAAIASF